MRKLIILLLLCASSVFAQTGSVTVDSSGNVIKPAAVNFPTPIPLKLNGVTINALPGNSKYWGTNGSNVFGYYNLPSGVSTFIGLDFTGNNMTFMNGTTMWKSTGDVTDPTTFTATNTGITQKDVNGTPMLVLWGDGRNGGNIFLTSDFPVGFTNGNVADDNILIGERAGTSITEGNNNNAIGSSSLGALTTGFENVSIGNGSGINTVTGSDNVFLGHQARGVEDASGLVIIGANSGAATGVISNAIVVGSDAVVSSDNSGVIGNRNVTNVYFGFNDSTGASNAAIHASNLVGGFTAHFSRGGAAIQTNDVLLTPWTCPYSGTITGYSISANTGTCTLKTWKKANGTAIPTIADVISTSGVSLSTGTHIRSSTVSDFTTTTVTAGDMFMAQVTSVSGSTDITFQVEITR